MQKVLSPSTANWADMSDGEFEPKNEHNIKNQCQFDTLQQELDNARSGLADMQVHNDTLQNTLAAKDKKFADCENEQTIKAQCQLDSLQQGARVW